MSAKQTGLVWELDLPHNEAWVLMAMADHADHDGHNVSRGFRSWPGRPATPPGRFAGSWGSSRRRGSYQVRVNESCFLQ
jgi:hypothetical protein